MRLESKNITKSFKERIVLKDVSLYFKNSEIVGILGPNGSGKTTLFSILSGVSFPSIGSIILNGKDITKLKITKRAKEGIVYLPQDSSIFRGLCVEDNIKAILQIKYKNKEDIENVLEDLLESFSLNHLRKAMAPLLSGGERRKVEIARALAANPIFLMLDEPFSGIDPISIYEITNIIQKLKENGIGIIITDHNVRETLNILDRGYIIANGKILISGTADDIMNDKKSRQIYLGDKFEI